MSKIASVEVFPIEIPFKTPFLLSRGFVGAPGKPGQHVYLKVTTRDGQVGWGESRPMPTWSYETMETVVSTLRNHIAPILEGEDPLSIGRIRREIDTAITPSISASQPFAISSVEQALYDLLGKETGTPLHLLLGGSLTDEMELAYMVSGHGDKPIEEAAEARKRGYTCFKVKISGDPDRDASTLTRLSQTLGDAKIWADANQAYNGATLPRLLESISGLPNIFCVEQPVPTYDYPGLSRAASRSRFPIAVDESVFTHYDLLRALNSGAADLVVLKLAKSGILNNIRIAALADAAGIPLLGSGMTESGIGFAASIHLFSTLPMALPVDTNGPQFLSHLLVDGLEIENARVRVPGGPGLGVEVDEDRVQELRAEPSI